MWVWRLSRPAEPVYGGKSLSDWAEQFGTNTHWIQGEGLNPLGKEAETAIRHIGTNAISALLQIMTLKPSPLKQRMIALIPGKWEDRFNLPTPRDYENEIYSRRGVGAAGLVALGADAKSAIPSLIAFLSVKDSAMRGMAMFALGGLGPVAKDAVPALTNCLKDPRAGRRLDAIWSLGLIHEEPEQVIPILIGYLHDKDWDFRNRALWSLSQFGAQAKPAIPQMLSLLNDTDYAVRGEATNAIREIEAAAKPGVR